MPNEQQPTPKPEPSPTPHTKSDEPEPKLPADWNQSDTDTDDQLQIKMDWLATQPFPGSKDPAKTLYTAYARGASIANFIGWISQAIQAILTKAFKMDKSTNTYKLGVALLGALQSGVIEFGNAVSRACSNLLRYGKLLKAVHLIRAVHIPPAKSVEDLTKADSQNENVWWPLFESLFEQIALGLPALDGIAIDGVPVSYRDIITSFLAAGHQFFDEWTKVNQSAHPLPPADNTPHIIPQQPGGFGVPEKITVGDIIGTDIWETETKQLIRPIIIEPISIPVM